MINIKYDSQDKAELYRVCIDSEAYYVGSSCPNIQIDRDNANITIKRCLVKNNILNAILVFIISLVYAALSVFDAPIDLTDTKEVNSFILTTFRARVQGESTIYIRKQRNLQYIFGTNLAQPKYKINKTPIYFAVAVITAAIGILAFVTIAMCVSIPNNIGIGMLTVLITLAALLLVLLVVYAKICKKLVALNKQWAKFYSDKIQEIINASEQSQAI